MCFYSSSKCVALSKRYHSISIGRKDFLHNICFMWSSEHWSFCLVCLLLIQTFLHIWTLQCFYLWTRFLLSRFCVSIETSTVILIPHLQNGAEANICLWLFSCAFSLCSSHVDSIFWDYRKDLKGFKLRIWYQLHHWNGRPWHFSQVCVKPWLRVWPNILYSNDFVKKYSRTCLQKDDSRLN